MSMGKKKIGVTESLRDKHIKQFERGLNTGNYVPYIRTQDFSSKGIRGRIACTKIKGRIYHCLSLNESFKLLDLLRDPDITDIKEQYAYTNLDKSKSFAKTLNIRHPKYKWSSLDAVITFDFFCTLSSGEHRVVSVKSADDLEDDRTQQKLVLEKAIAESEKYEFVLALDTEIKTEETRNTIRVLRGARLNEKLDAIYSQWLGFFSSQLSKYPHKPLSKLIKQAAEYLNINFRESFTLMQHGFWVKHLISDPETPLLPELTPYQLGVECYV